MIRVDERYGLLVLLPIMVGAAFSLLVETVEKTPWGAELWRGAVIGVLVGAAFVGFSCYVIWKIWREATYTIWLGEEEIRVRPYWGAEIWTISPTDASWHFVRSDGERASNLDGASTVELRLDDGDKIRVSRYAHNRSKLEEWISG